MATPVDGDDCGASWPRRCPVDCQLPKDYPMIWEARLIPTHCTCNKWITADSTHNGPATTLRRYAGCSQARLQNPFIARQWKTESQAHHAARTPKIERRNLLFASIRISVPAHRLPQNQQFNTIQNTDTTMPKPEYADWSEYYICTYASAQQLGSVFKSNARLWVP